EGPEVGVVIGRLADQDVAAVAGAKGVLAGAADQDVTAGPAEELVAAGPADQDVAGGAAARVEIVVAGIAEQVGRDGQQGRPVLDHADVVVAGVPVSDHAAERGRGGDAGVDGRRA